MSEHQASLFGTEPHKLHRLGAPSTSVKAAHQVDSRGDEMLVYQFIDAIGAGGATLKDLQPLMKKDRSSFSGRISALLRKELILDTGKRRDGCRVYVINPEGRA